MSVIKIEKRPRSGNTGCCVVLCHNTYSKTDSNIKFYSFPSKPYLLERRKKWIKAVNRINSDGTPWQPTSNSRICSLHFIGGSKSEDPRHPAYYPTIFPAKNKRKEPSNVNLDRFNRWKKRQSVSEASFHVSDDQQEQIIDLSEDIDSKIGVNEQLKQSKSIQVTSFEQINGNFIFSCDFNGESNSVSTQATISTALKL